MASDPTRMCELLVGLDHVDVLDVEVEGLEVTITIETRQILVGCPSCGVLARSKGRRSVRLADVNHGFRRVNVLWIKRRWCWADSTGQRNEFSEFLFRHHITECLARTSVETPLDLVEISRREF